MVQYKNVTASRELSSQSISNVRVPTDVLVYFTKEDELVDELLRRRQWEDEFNKILEFYDRIFEYTIDGKKVSAKEFHEYVSIFDKENEKGDEYWYVKEVAQEDVH